MADLRAFREEMEAKTAKQTKRLGALWGLLRSQLSELSVQNIRKTAGAAGFDVSQVPATAEAKSGMGSRAEVLPALDVLFGGMDIEAKIRVLTALGSRLIENPMTSEKTRVLLVEQGFAVVDNKVVLSARSEADVDHLTSLPNLRSFDSDIQQMLSDAVASDEPMALLAFDIDKFKSVNDDHGGHAIGNEALIGVAQITAKIAKGKGTAYRLGGDEFAVLLPNQTSQEALAVAERIRLGVNDAKLTTRNLTLSVSIGIAEYPVHGTTVDTLKKAADDASYDSKQRGRNLVRIFGEPEPAAAPMRQPERKEAIAGNLTSDQQTKIRLDYFRSGSAACPKDGARLRVQSTSGMGQQTESIHVACPICGLAEELK